MSEYSPLAIGLKVFSIFSMATSTADVIAGHKALIPASERALLPKSTLSVLDNQLRFLGAVWGGYGALLWWASNDLETRQTPLAVLGAVMFIAGIGRTASGLATGWGAPWLKVAAGIELVFPPLIYLFGF
ncbi:hypothetical protein NXS19_008399 [Fusarium pseudograminearum]|uniref:DUF4345 domain-containing protein n=1 Tax=Fusarium pseudograminearum (strain CS3096) TaxID=1028729 RepID=K3VPV4_FUSPC|nr:hypothetical protein FPSE_03988 [Fusarium pseudograminearum CS3096]EKJ75808.1 hypothetical protein FPSE_03988 [Fusarium pseudograminearum CS3096]KAF0642258.1 hypothetical protein FPSE5266_03988 [Fusarium pseudograminearum]UZP40583.1 hypothetical protein NXS19_008399 [Fusarium pseudograminearum]